MPWFRTGRFLTAILYLCLVTSIGQAQNRVLSLDGDGDYVRLPSDIFNDLDEATVEGWVRWESLRNYSRFFECATQKQGMVVYCYSPTRALQFYIYNQNQQSHGITTPGVLQRGGWFHIAAVSGVTGMKLYLNGVLVGEDDYTGSFSSIQNSNNNYLGGSISPRFHMHGQIDECRVWRVARTANQIRASMFAPLRGDEPGLVGYWNFESQAEKAIDATGNGHDGELFGDAMRVATDLPTSLPQPAVISGILRNEKGMPLRGADIALKQGNDTVAEVQSNRAGRYTLAVFPKGRYDLFATSENLGDLRLGIRLRPGERQTINFTLKEAVSIEGQLRMLDDTTPHVAVLVEAVQGDGVVDSTLSDENGKYRFVNLKPGKYRVRCRVPSGDVSPLSFDARGAGGQGVLYVQRGKTISGVDFRFAPFKSSHRAQQP